MYRNYVKRVIELVLALFGLLFVSPIFLFIVLFLSIQNSGTPFFFQRRGGFKNKVFKVIKFKTMNDKRDEKGELLPDHQRLTSVGKFIRKTSLDELPQLINVIKGEMGIIGPRPFLAEYLEIYSVEQKRRHDVRPGITGWAQVNGRNNLSWAKKFELDIWYVENVSFLLDLRILFLTLKKVFFFKDVNKQGEATTVKFNGTN